jgi:hypothetical protein
MWVLAALAIGSAIAQWSQSNNAAKASAAERDKIQQFYQNIKQPNFDPTSITPEDYQVLQKYIPEAAPYVAIGNPKVIEQTQGMAAGRQAQMEALQRLRGISSSINNPELTAQIQQAQQAAAQQANTQSQSILQQQARRGLLGSGNMIAAQLQAGSGAQQQEAASGQNAAIAAYQQRLQALQQGAQLGGQIQNEDVNLQAKNADILNRYNEMAANRAQQYGQYVAGQANDAQKYNVGMAQDVANANVSGRNQAALGNLQRRNAIAQQQYGNQLNMGQGMQGIAQTNIAGIQQQARDTNNAISGATGALSTVGMNAYNNDRADQRAKQYGGNNGQPIAQAGTSGDNTANEEEDSTYYS